MCWVDCTSPLLCHFKHSSCVSWEAGKMLWLYLHYKALIRATWHCLGLPREIWCPPAGHRPILFITQTKPTHLLMQDMLHFTWSFCDGGANEGKVSGGADETGGEGVNCFCLLWWRSTLVPLNIIGHFFGLRAVIRVSFRLAFWCLSHYLFYRKTALSPCVQTQVNFTQSTFSSLPGWPGWSPCTGTASPDEQSAGSGSSSWRWGLHTSSPAPCNCWTPAVPKVPSRCNEVINMNTSHRYPKQIVVCSPVL